MDRSLKKFVKAFDSLLAANKDKAWNYFVNEKGERIEMDVAPKKQATQDWEWEAVKDGVALEVKLEVIARNGKDGKVIAGWGIRDEKMLTVGELKIAIDPVLPNLGQRLVDMMYKGFIQAHGPKFLDALRTIQNSVMKSGLVRVLKDKAEESKIIISN